MWWVLRWVLAILLQPGGVPRHVAFIMDGNRRFATRKSMSRLQGHTKGYSKMIEAVYWCLELGVPYISVYAFSIDNFSRSIEEVETLMNLAEEKYNELSSTDGLFAHEGVEIRVVGDLSLAPLSVQQSAARVMKRGAALPVKQAVLNICFSYTSSEELIHSMDVLSGGVQAGGLQSGDITPELLLRCLRTQATPPVDLMIRTSGETRLSDFLLWQCSHAQLEWVDCLWPDWGYLSFISCVARWQQQHTQCQRLMAAAQHRMQQAGMTPSADATDLTSGDAAHIGSTASPNVRQVQQEEPRQGAARLAKSGLLSCCGDDGGGQLAGGLFDGLCEQFMWDPPTNWAPHVFVWRAWVCRACCWWAALVEVVLRWWQAGRQMWARQGAVAASATAGVEGVSGEAVPESDAAPRWRMSAPGGSEGCAATSGVVVPVAARGLRHRFRRAPSGRRQSGDDMVTCSAAAEHVVHDSMADAQEESDMSSTHEDVHNYVHLVTTPVKLLQQQQQEEEGGQVVVQAVSTSPALLSHLPQTCSQSSLTLSSSVRHVDLTCSSSPCDDSDCVSSDTELISSAAASEPCSPPHLHHASVLPSGPQSGVAVAEWQGECEGCECEQPEGVALVGGCTVPCTCCNELGVQGCVECVSEGIQQQLDVSSRSDPQVCVQQAGNSRVGERQQQVRGSKERQARVLAMLREQQQRHQEWVDQRVN